MEEKTINTEVIHNNEPKKTFIEVVKDFFGKDLVQYVIKRVLMFIPTLILISILVFFVIQLPPGDFVSQQISALQAEGEYVTAEEAAEMRAEYGLDLPFWQQYLKWIGDIVWTSEDTEYYRLYQSHHNWKFSFTYGRQVWDVIEERLGLTILVTAIIMIFQYSVSLPVAIYAATHQYSKGDYIASFVGFIGAAVPNFILAIILMYLSFIWTGNANVGLFSQDIIDNGLTIYNFGDLLSRMVIPIIVIGTSGTCGIIRSVRAQMLDEIGRQYTLTARAKGVSEWTITMKYCFRAAINPTVSGLGGILSSLFSGSTVTAMVLNLQIQGPELLKALRAQDMYLAGAIVMVQAILVVIGILLSDIALAFLDPRIRYSGGNR